MLSEMEDTTYITQGRDLSERGGKGLLENYEKVNVFSEPTQQSLQARVNDMYRKAELDYGRQYRQAANKMNQANYRRFGTLNATPAAYASNLQELRNQEHLADMAYQKAKAYDQAVNNELQRRYNTINMYKAMYGLGETPYQHDVQNWKIRNENLDRQYQNQLAKSSSGFDWGSLLGTGLSIAGTAAMGGLGGAGGGLASLFGGAGSSAASSALSGAASNALSGVTSDAVGSAVQQAGSNIMNDAWGWANDFSFSY